MACKIVPEMTYNVLIGTLSLYTTMALHALSQCAVVYLRTVAHSVCAKVIFLGLVLCTLVVFVTVI